MGSLRLAMLVMVLGASGAFAADEPATPDATPAPANPTDRNPPSTSAAEAADDGGTRERPEPPAAPRKYLEAGANLFNRARFDLARKYLLAAHMYRDRLTASERVVLDVYREKLDHLSLAQAAGSGSVTTAGAASVPPTLEPKAAPAPAATGDPSVAPVSLSTPNPSRGVTPPLDPIKALSRRPDEDAMPNMAVPPGFDAPAPGNSGDADPSMPQPMADRIASEPGLSAGSVNFRGTIDTKQKARWLLQLAREQIRKQHFDLAEQAIAEARSLDVKWTMFDETPERLTEALNKARTKAGVKASPLASAPFPSLPNGDGPRDRRAAKARLKEARLALAANHLDRADEIVREVRSWGVSFGLFDDTPDKVAAAIYDARRKDALRNADQMIQSYYREQERYLPARGPGVGTMTGPPVRPTLPD